jgi:penicillin-binding protein 1C
MISKATSILAALLLVPLLVYVLVLSALEVFNPLRPVPAYSKVVYAKDGELLKAFLSPDDKWRLAINRSEILPELEKAFLHKEDKRFYHHNGVDFIALSRALFNNIFQAKRTSGASTITMQVVRLTEPRPRTYLNKIFEFFRAWQLELHYSKSEILEMYLTLVPYGGNIEGIKAASLIYFGKMPHNLDLSEITQLTIIPNKPNSLRPDRFPEQLKNKRDEWLHRFEAEGVFESYNVALALGQPIVSQRYLLPKYAPHLAYRLTNSNSRVSDLHSTIDFEMQQQTEQLVQNHMLRLVHLDIQNAAVIIIENATGAVRAYVGSADFNKRADGGQVDGVRAVRSPGSTLKPYLFAKAFEAGIVTPKMCYDDVPVAFGTYEPENYDGLFRGKVSADYALIQSLNIPAVHQLHRLGIQTFTDDLKKAGFNQLKDNQLGLSTILGGCGATLEELTALFSSFARGGLWQLPVYLQSDTAERLRLMETGTAFMLSEILSGVIRPDLPAEWQNTLSLPRIAWKTGTSYGRRDAWSIGYSPKYTIGVWVGNFSNRSAPTLSGATCAAPLLFDLFSALGKADDGEWPLPEEELNFRLVCSESGLISGDYCNNLITDYYVPGASPYQKCEHLNPVYVSADSSVSYCRHCLPETGYRLAVYPNPSPALLAWQSRENIRIRSVPPHFEGCERLLSGLKPRITSPVLDFEYYIDFNDSSQVMLFAEVAADVKHLHWYLNDEYVGKVNAGTKFFVTPPIGLVKVSCSDDKGRNSNLYFKVKSAS